MCWSPADLLHPSPPEKKYAISPALAAVIGTNTESRPQCVSKIWDYIRSHNLQNPSDKREILCDDKLQAVFGQVRGVKTRTYASARCKYSPALTLPPALTTRPPPSSLHAQKSVTMFNMNKFIGPNLSEMQ